MKGLILKDLYLIKFSIVFMALFTILYSGILQISYVTLNNSVINNSIISLLIALNGFLGATSFIYEMKTKWEKYEGVLPISIEKRVLVKFIVPLLSTIVNGLLVFMSICIYQNFAYEVWYINTNINILILGISLSMILAGIIIAITYKIGPEKSRIVVVAGGGIVGAITGVMFPVVYIEKDPIITNFLGLSMTAKVWIFFVISIIFSFLMYKLSVYIVKKKKCN